MALRLDDLQSSKRPAKRPEEFRPALYEQTVEERQPEKLRPWQAQEDQQATTRTYAAKEAVQRARERSLQNEELARKLRQGHVSLEREEQLALRQAERERFFAFEAAASEADTKIRTSSMFVKFFRDLLRQ